MKIKKLEDDYIEFDNGMKITCEHAQECCEHNYADFKSLKDTPAMDNEFNEDLKFDSVENLGFVFGDNHYKFFVPCYSIQNGYYTSSIKVFYNNELVINELKCNLIEY